MEPIAVFSKKVKKLQDLKKGATIIVSSNVPDYGRILQIFKDAGLITLKKGIDITSANFSDIASNPRHLKFKHSYEPKLLPTIYKNGEGDAVVINANYAVGAGLNPIKQSIAIEKRDSPYVNIIATRMVIRRSQPSRSWSKRFNQPVHKNGFYITTRVLFFQKRMLSNINYVPSAIYLR